MALAGRCRAGHDMPGGGRRGCPGCRRDQVVDLAAAADQSLPRAAVAAAVDAVAPGGQALWHLGQALAAGPEALSFGAPPLAGRLAAELIARGSATLTARRRLRRVRADRAAADPRRCRRGLPALPGLAAGRRLQRVREGQAGRDAHGRWTAAVRGMPAAVRPRQPPLLVLQQDSADRDPRPRRPARHLRELLPDARSHLRRVRPSPRMQLRRDQPSGLPVVLAKGNRRMRALRPGPPAPGPLAGRAVCDPCYTAALRLRGRCASCGQMRRLAAPPGLDPDTCSDCAGLPVTHACTGCGIEDKLYEHGRCDRCSLQRRAAALLAGPDGQITTGLLPVFGAICAARTPKSALNWLRRSRGAAMLADLASGKLPASHQALDAHPRRRAADFLRQMLTSGGALPPRDEELARTGQWLTSVLDAVEPDPARRLVRAYATWQVMRRLRASAGCADRPRTYTAHARRNIRAAASFLTWLHSRALAACRQADVEAWLATGPAACQARDFLSWAARHRHCPRFAVPGPVRAVGVAASQDERWALAARLLHDGTLDLTDRAAGCMLLLYGQQLSRIAVMTTSQVTSHDGAMHVRFGDHDVPVPEPLGVVLTKLIRNGRSHTGTGSPAVTPWLFPSGLPGQPITAGRLGGRLRALGIYAIAGRRSALTDLAAQLPAAVLADLLGLAPGTAVRWMRQAGSDWSGYAAELARTRHRQP